MFTFLLGPARESATSACAAIGHSHGKEPQLRNNSQSARQYELMAIFAPDVAEENLAGAVEHVSGILTTAGGNVTLILRDSPWGRRRLAYPIRHESRDVRDGIYVLYYFESDASRIVEIERDLKLTTNVIRYMVTKQSAPPILPPEPEDAPEEMPIVVQAPATPVPGTDGTPAADTAPAVDAASAVDAEPEVDAVPAADAAPIMDAVPTAEGASNVGDAPATEAVLTVDEAPATESAPADEVPASDADAAGQNEGEAAADAPAAGEAGDEPGPQG